MLDQSRPEPLTAAELDKPGIRHGFFTRAGGVSDGLYRGLNVGAGSKDDLGHVRENRRRVAGWLGVAPNRLATVYQVHSPDVILIEGPQTGERPKADALVSRTPGIALGVLTADCGPVLLADAEAGVVGAAHAGWKGALDGVLDNVVDAMKRLGARHDNIQAVLGPSISQQNYEVGPEFADRFIAADPANETYFAPSQRAGHAFFDLNRYTVDRLARTGVQATMLGRCTYAEEELFFSFRRTTHRKEPDYGRQISAIVLEER
jgi:polyphenol oxidase